MPNLELAWLWILVGLLSGAVQGLFFHREHWLRGYDSWPRRLTRLGHIAFFGTAFLNIGFALSVQASEVRGTLVDLSSTMLIVGAAAMPTACYLSAWRKPLRRLFPIPVLALVGGVSMFTVALMRDASQV